MLPAIVMPVAVACSECHDGLGNESESRFEIRGNISDVSQTRGMAEGTVPDGNGYRISYPSTSDKYVIDTCVFTKGTGLVTNADGHFLTWSDIGHSQSYTFYLDNVVLHDDKSLVELSDDYVAGFDTPEAKNDIVWGSLKLTDRTTVNLKFELYHRMSMMSVCVKSVSSNELHNATVALKGIVLRPYSFNRMTGEVGLTDTPVYSDAMLRDDSEEWLPESATKEIDGTETAKFEYRTQAFILPPQRLRTGSDRPRLQIVIPDGKYAGTYSAALPTSLSVTTPEGTTSMQTLSRLTAGQHLTLNVTLLHDNDKPVLEFRPASVEQWTEKGTHGITAKHEGIYELDDFTTLIAAYNKLDEGDDSKDWLRIVDRYGKKDTDDKWIFYLFTNLEFNIDDNTELFSNGNFTFQMHGCSITVGDTKYDESKLDDLISLLSGSIK